MYILFCILAKSSVCLRIELKGHARARDNNRLNPVQSRVARFEKMSGIHGRRCKANRVSFRGMTASGPPDIPAASRSEEDLMTAVAVEAGFAKTLDRSSTVTAPLR
jgi:hypothetical protein